MPDLTRASAADVLDESLAEVVKAALDDGMEYAEIIAVLRSHISEIERLDRAAEKEPPHAR